MFGFVFIKSRCFLEIFFADFVDLMLFLSLELELWRDWIDSDPGRDFLCK